jgi:hypothetical protein
VKIVCVLYDDPVDGYPAAYARDDVPRLEPYPNGQTLPTPHDKRAKLPLDQLVSNRLPLDEIAAGFEQTGRGDGIRTLISMSN